MKQQQLKIIAFFVCVFASLLLSCEKKNEDNALELEELKTDKIENAPERIPPKDDNSEGEPDPDPTTLEDPLIEKLNNTISTSTTPGNQSVTIGVTVKGPADKVSYRLSGPATGNPPIFSNITSPKVLKLTTDNIYQAESADDLSLGQYRVLFIVEYQKGGKDYNRSNQFLFDVKAP